MKQWTSIWPTKKKYEGAAAKPLNFLDLTAIGIGGSVAFGISVLIGQLIKHVTGPAAVVSVSLAGFTALVGGLCFAEFGVRFLRVDTVYAYCYLWSKETSAFTFGWVLILQYVAGTASAAKGVITFIDSLTECRLSDFIKSVTPLNTHEVFPYFDFLSLGIVAVVTILMRFGMKEPRAVKKLFTACNIILIICVITAGAFRAELKNLHPEGTPDGKFEAGFIPYGVLGIAKGAAIAVYGFIGFDTVSITGNEIKKRKRNLPLAIIATIIFTLVAYAGVGMTLSLMLPYHMHDPHAAVPFAFQQAGWITLKWIVVVATFFGFQISLCGVIFQVPRVIYAMANDGLLFHCLGNSNSKLRIPVTGSVTGGLVAATAAGFLQFEKLVNLTVMGALFIFTNLAISIILLRYTPKPELEEQPSWSWPRLINSDSDVSLKAILQNCFTCTANNPTNLTKTIISGNLISFCLSSIGIGIIFNVYNDLLTECALKAVIPTGILLCILLLNVISMMYQPKSQESVPFKVPLVPFLPCLSIFLNIFLMLTFESLSWIFFWSWIAAGIIPFAAWRFLKRCKEGINKNSIYEINKSNAIKLCDSIWKIKSDKKSFYEGAVNPTFVDEMDEPSKVNIDNNGDINKHSRLEQVDVIQKAESVVEVKTEPLGNESQFKFAYAKDAEIENHLTEEEKVQWECVAEIHTEDEFPQESIALEIVDDTYNFLSELSRDDAVQNLDEAKERSEESNNNSPHVDASENTYFEGRDATKESAQFPSPQPISEKSEHLKGNGHLLLKEELLSKIKQRTENKEKERNELSNGHEIDQDSLIKGNYKKQFNQKSPGNGSPIKSMPSNLYSFDEMDQQEKIKGTFFVAVESEITVSDNNGGTGASKAKEATSLLDEQNKVKEFKEKLNQLLKSQVNGSAVLTKNLPFSRANVGVGTSSETDINDKEDKNVLRNSLKTLNKSQIRGKLEFLLAKGPPKRPSLGGSFNIKIKETVDEIKLQKSEDGFPKSKNNPMLDVEVVGEKSGKYSSDLSNETEKVFSLENSKLDVCC